MRIHRNVVLLLSGVLLFLFVCGTVSVNAQRRPATGNLKEAERLNDQVTRLSGEGRYEEDNVAKAGRIIEIPARTDETPWFDLSLPTLKPNRVAERLTVIVTMQPLNVAASNQAIRLDPTQLQTWEQQWGGETRTLEEKTTVNQTWTTSEKEAGEGNRLLQQNDPLPKTIYRVKANSGEAVLFHIILKIAK